MRNVFCRYCSAWMENLPDEPDGDVISDVPCFTCVMMGQAPLPEETEP